MKIIPSFCNFKNIDPKLVTYVFGTLCLSHSKPIYFEPAYIFLSIDFLGLYNSYWGSNSFLIVNNKFYTSMKYKTRY